MTFYIPWPIDWINRYQVKGYNGQNVTIATKVGILYQVNQCIIIIPYLKNQTKNKLLDHIIIITCCQKYFLTTVLFFLFLLLSLFLSIYLLFLYFISSNNTFNIVSCLCYLWVILPSGALCSCSFVFPPGQYMSFVFNSLSSILLINAYALHEKNS